MRYPGLISLVDVLLCTYSYAVETHKRMYVPMYVRRTILVATCAAELVFHSFSLVLWRHSTQSLCTVQEHSTLHTVCYSGYMLSFHSRQTHLHHSSTTPRAGHPDERNDDQSVLLLLAIPGVRAMACTVEQDIEYFIANQRKFDTDKMTSSQECCAYCRGERPPSPVLHTKVVSMATTPSTQQATSAFASQVTMGDARAVV